MNEEIYKIVPCSEIKELNEDTLLGQGLSYGAYFKALYKKSEKECGIITIHIFGKLNIKWHEKIQTAYQQRKEIQMPLIIQEGTGFVASISTI